MRWSRSAMQVMRIRCILCESWKTPGLPDGVDLLPSGDCKNLQRITKAVTQALQQDSLMSSQCVTPSKGLLYAGVCTSMSSKHQDYNLEMMSSGLSLVTGHVCTSVHKSPFVAPDQCLRGWQPVDAPGAEKCLAAGTRVPRGGWTGHGLLARLPTAVLSWSVWCHGSDVLCRL